MYAFRTQQMLGRTNQQGEGFVRESLRSLEHGIQPLDEFLTFS